MSIPLSIGETAPDFTLPSHQNEKVALKDLRGKSVVVFFYPLDWTPV